MTHEKDCRVLFQLEVEKFRRWAASYSDAERYGEWECEYAEWPELYSATCNFLAASAPNRWSEAEIQNLLYVIARDNESEFLVKEVASDADRLFLLARAAVTTSEDDAKWQLAAQLGESRNFKGDAEQVLLSLVDDSNDYVSRRALLALGALRSSHVELLAERAWATEHQYQRIAALHALKQVSSPKLAYFIKEALKDGREYLVQNAMQLSET